MPPWPIDVLLGVVGIGAYAAIGGVVGSFVLHIFSPENYHKHLAGKKNYKYPAETVLAMTAATLFWPAELAIVVVIGALMGPAWITKKVGRYVAAAQIEREGG